jgi:hypothetical protein
MTDVIANFDRPLIEEFAPSPAHADQRSMAATHQHVTAHAATRRFMEPPGEEAAVFPARSTCGRHRQRRQQVGNIRQQNQISKWRRSARCQAHAGLITPCEQIDRQRTPVRIKLARRMSHPELARDRITVAQALSRGPPPASQGTDVTRNGTPNTAIATAVVVDVLLCRDEGEKCRTSRPASLTDVRAKSPQTARRW